MGEEGELNVKTSACLNQTNKYHQWDWEWDPTPQRYSSSQRERENPNIAVATINECDHDTCKLTSQKSKTYPKVFCLTAGTSSELSL